MNFNKTNTEVLKEPRGFIKIIEFFCSIVAFACVANWSDTVQVSVPCNTTEVKASATFKYPFALDFEVINIPVCKAHKGVPAGKIDFMADEVHQSQFFVFIGVVSFLATMGIVAGYVLYDEVYLRTPRIVWGDVVFHALLGFMWFVSSCAFASSVSDIKYYGNAAYLIKQLGDECKGVHVTCPIDKDPTYAGLHIGALMGFLNCFLWFANIWFLYKETRAQQGDFVDETVDPSGGGGGGGGGGYDPYGPGTGSPWGSGPSAVQGGLNEI